MSEVPLYHDAFEATSRSEGCASALLPQYKGTLLTRNSAPRGLYRGSWPMRKRLPPYDPSRPLGIGLR